MFKLYTEENLTLKFDDYATILRECSALGAKTALEFGPGYTTLALIEAGLIKIVSLEHNEEWFEKMKIRFAEYPQVEVRRYQDEPEATADLAADEQFDMAIVDSPQGFNRQIRDRISRKRHPGQADCSRFNTCVLALKHAPVVYLHDANRPLERCTLERLNALGHRVTQLKSKYGLARIERGQDANRPDTPGA